MSPLPKKINDADTKIFRSSKRNKRRRERLKLKGQSKNKWKECGESKSETQDVRKLLEEKKTKTIRKCQIIHEQEAR